MSTKEISLENRYNGRFVNGVFKANILLNLAYMRGEEIDARDVKWDEVTKPFAYRFVLSPGKTFAFHEDVLVSTVAPTNHNFIDIPEVPKSFGLELSIY